VASALIAGAGDAAARAQDGKPAEAQSVRLSDERWVTRWAYPLERWAARRAPNPAAAVVTKLRLVTEDGRPELYVALRKTTDLAGQEWVQLRLPMRPNGTTGWVKREALGSFHTVRTFLQVNRSLLRATLYRRGRAVWTSRIGVGAPGSPTPAGRFYVREKLTSFGGGFYGPVAFATSAYAAVSDWPFGVVGIHGTSQPELIPGRISHGCMRVPNPAIQRLAALMPIGTPVHIL
jgi:L,D-transpeptidase catalytic domain